MASPRPAPDRIARMRLARGERIGPATYRKLIARTGSAEAAIEALPDLARAGGGSAPKIISTDLAAREFDRAAQLGAHLLFLDEPGYPPLLARLHDAPAVIAVLGDPACLSRPGVAIVGSRNASANGCLLAEQLAEGLVAARLAVISGLARGIDGAAHEGALRNGTTLAVVAGGLDKPYPPQHEALQARIAEAGGAVVAEAPFGTAAQARHFPRRNRIIAGLALAVVVIEAAQRSGSLITARIALEEGRELFAAPGSPLDPRCRGSNDLIRQGAHLTETIEDILSHLPADPAAEGLHRLPLFARDATPDEAAFAEPPPALLTPPSAPDPRLRDQLVTLLSHAPCSVDALIERCQVSAAAVNATLLELELAGGVTFLPGQRVVLHGQMEEHDEEAADWADGE